MKYGMKEIKVTFTQNHEDILAGILSKLDENHIRMNDHCNGFDIDGENKILRTIDTWAKDKDVTVWLHQYLTEGVRRLYPNVTVKFDVDLQDALNFYRYSKFDADVDNTFEHFITCFCGKGYDGRHILSAELISEGMWDWETCTRNFDLTDTGYIYKKYDRNMPIVNEDDTYKTHSIDYVPLEQLYNLNVLHQSIATSFINVVSETESSKHYPFVTEKFLFPILTNTLFVAHAQLGWHKQIRDIYGFQLYPIFDYTFDDIANPVDRARALVNMLKPFQHLSKQEWIDLTKSQEHVILYNNKHLRSGNYLQSMKRWEY